MSGKIRVIDQKGFIKLRKEKDTHGAMVTEDAPDAEGILLKEIREIGG